MENAADREEHNVRPNLFSVETGYTWKRLWWWTTPSWLCRRDRSEYSVCSSIFPCLSS